MKDVTRSYITKNFLRHTHSKSAKVKGSILQRTLRSSFKKKASGIKIQHSYSVPSVEQSTTPIIDFKIGKDRQNISKQV